MKARMEVTLDTTWTNQVLCSVECELDNPHSLTSKMLSELMIQRLQFMVQEVRHASERSIPDLLAPDDGEGQARARVSIDAAGTPERERRAYEDMRRDRDVDVERAEG